MRARTGECAKICRVNYTKFSTSGELPQEIHTSDNVGTIPVEQDIHDGGEPGNPSRSLNYLIDYMQVM
jgi:hypothetical protein